MGFTRVCCKKRNENRTAVTLLTVILSTTCFLPCAVARPDSTKAASVKSWQSEKSFVSYDTAQREIISFLKSARYRALVVTPELTDGKIATAIHSLQLRNKFVQVLVDSRSKRLYNSRHGYLVQAEVPVFFRNGLSRKLRGHSLVVADNIALTFSASLRSNQDQSVQLGPAPLLAGEVLALFSNLKSLKKLPRGAKTPTRSARARAAKSDKIRLRSRTLPRGSTRGIPRRLPQQTRFEEVESGAAAVEAPVEPVRRLDEGTLRLDNESELGAE